MSAESLQIESNAAPKRVSYNAIIAIIIAIGAVFLSLQTFHSSIESKIKLNAAIASLQQTTQQQAEQLRLLQPTQMQKTLATISYLMHLANLQLTINHDPATALTTLILAQQQLNEDNNLSFSNLKQALNSDIAALRAVPSVDISTIFSDISNMNAQIQILSPLPEKPVISVQNTMNQIKSTGNEPWYHRLIDGAKQVKTLFVVRHLDQENTPLIAPNQEMGIKQNGAIQLSIAQWALLHHHEKIYQSALQNVSQWLTQYFAFSDAKNPILNQLAALEKIQINPPLPSLNNTLSALSAVEPVTGASATVSPAVTTPTIIPTQIPKPTQAPALVPSAPSTPSAPPAPQAPPSIPQKAGIAT